MEGEDKCASCSGVVIVDTIRADRVCQDCGLVAGRVLDAGPEWRLYSEEAEGSLRHLGNERADVRGDDTLGEMSSSSGTHLVGAGSSVLNKLYLTSEEGRASLRNSRLFDSLNLMCEHLRVTKITQVSYM